MIKLTRGDKDSLEGRVVIYGTVVRKRKQDPTELPSHAPETTIIAMYAATSITDFVSSHFIKRLSPSPESLRQLEETDARMKRHAKEAPMDASGTMNPVYSLFLPPLWSENELSQGSEDIVFAGEYHSSSLCRTVLRKVLDIYMLCFEDQAAAKSKAGSPKKGAVKQRLVTYKDIPGKDIFGYISTNYVSHMLDAQRQGDKEEFRRLKTEFVLFGLNSPFKDDLSALCAEIENNGRTPNLPLIEAYVRKISAMHAEDYRAAAEHHSRILGLMKRAQNQNT